MLRKVRVVLALLFFILLTVMFLDVTGVLRHWFGWMAEMQFLPAVLAGNFLIVALVMVVTLLFGRWYCSVVCPLGVMQDGFNFVGRKVKKNRFCYTRPLHWLRYSLLIIFVALVAVGLTAIAALIAPYSAYGRIATNVFQPVYLWFNNILANIAWKHQSYAFVHHDVWLKSGASLVVALATFMIVGLLSLRRGRTWCSTVCPVGTFLGLLSRFSLFRPVIDADKCKNCRMCEKRCKASCIDIEHHRIDYSRCVSCMDCVENCKFDALHYKHTHFRLSPATIEKERERVDESRRSFVTTTALLSLTGVLSAQEKRVDGGLAVVEDKKIPQREVPIKPAGSVSLKHFGSHCTACHLCVSECPNQVLRPSKDLTTFMQPEMSYERGFCRPECTRCSEVCPTGAIKHITKEQKTDIHIGFASVVVENCLPYSRDVACGNCARHCPSQAILMVPKNRGEEGSMLVPSVLTEQCTGCGACEYLCPSRPFSAIFVTGRSVHS